MGWTTQEKTGRQSFSSTPNPWMAGAEIVGLLEGTGSAFSAPTQNFRH